MSISIGEFYTFGLWLCVVSAIVGLIFLFSYYYIFQSDSIHIFAITGESITHHNHGSPLIMSNSSLSFTNYLNSSNSNYNSQAYPDKIRTVVFDALSNNDKPLLCGDNKIHSNFYVKEFITPILCSQPVALTVDKLGMIWMASGKSGTLQVFNPDNGKFEKVIKIPNWPQQDRNIGSMVWDLKFDKNGNLWFTDELSNSIWKYFTKEGKFENYRLLAEGGYPLSITFDSENNVWFTQVFGKRLGFIEPSKTVSNTTEGISELDMSKQVNFQTMGPISNGYSFSADNLNNSSDNLSEVLWFSTAIFPVGGQIIKYDINAQSLTIHDLNNTHSVPFSIAEDEHGTLWANSHIANLFLSLDPKTGAVKQYATSNPSASGNLTTLPYYNLYKEGKVWFNEHYGNTIASFDAKNHELVEYHIPSHNPLWVNSSNPLRFTFDENGSIWFTEWTENKLAVIPADRLNQIPISLNLSKNNLTLDRTSGKGDTLDVMVYENPVVTNSKMNPSDYNISHFEGKVNQSIFDRANQNLTLAVTSSISKDGKLVNMTSNFSELKMVDRHQNDTNEKMEYANPNPRVSTFTINSKSGLVPGEYTLTISVNHNDDLTVSKVVDLFIK